MLQFAAEGIPQYQRLAAGGGYNGGASNDQLADVEVLAQDEDLDDLEQWNNPKSKTTNMSSMLKQINKSIEKAGKAQQPKCKCSY